jgi:hypothetical protein
VLLRCWRLLSWRRSCIDDADERPTGRRVYYVRGNFSARRLVRVAPAYVTDWPVGFFVGALGAIVYLAGRVYAWGTVSTSTPAATQHLHIGVRLTKKFAFYSAANDFDAAIADSRNRSKDDSMDCIGSSGSVCRLPVVTENSVDAKSSIAASVSVISAIRREAVRLAILSSCSKERREDTLQLSKARQARVGAVGDRFWEDRYVETQLQNNCDSLLARRDFLLAGRGQCRPGPDH